MFAILLQKYKKLPIYESLSTEKPSAPAKRQRPSYAHALYREQGYHERVLECTAVVMVVYHLLAATGYALGVSATLVSVSEAVAVASVLLSCVAGGGMAIYGYRRQRTVGLLLAAATLTAYPLWEEPGIAVLWWTANKVLTGWLYLLVRRVLVEPT